MALTTHIQPSGHLKKNEFGEVDETMFQGAEKPCEHNLWALKKATWPKSLKVS
jgi:hypothetical protein